MQPRRRDAHRAQGWREDDIRISTQKSFIRFLVAPPCTDSSTAFKDLIGVIGPAEPADEKIFSKFRKVDQDVRTVKALLDPYKNDPEVSKVLRAVFPYVNLRRLITSQCGGQIVTNAWLKIYEIVTQMGLFDIACTVTDERSILRVFCNAELPGAFVSALNHYVCIWHPHMQYRWVASSLYPDPDSPKMKSSDSTESPKRTNSSDVLDDYYGLYSQNQSQWLMDVNMRGDVTDVPSIRELARRAKEKLGEVDLYTSDVGIDVSEDYSNQEQLTALLNLGQLVVGMMSLRIGGALVVKTYTFTCPYSISVISLCATLFETFYVTKPKTSRAANSETYLVGIGFRGLTEEEEKFLLDAVQNFNFSVPLFPLGYSGAEHTIKSLLVASITIHQHQQVATLREAVDIFKIYRGQIRILHQKVRHQFSIMERHWLADNPVHSLPKQCLLYSNDHPRKHV